MAVLSSKATEYTLKLLPLTHSWIYFPIMTAGLYIIPHIIRLLVKTIEDIPPKYLFLMILLPFRDFRKEKIVFHADRSLKFQVLLSNALLADFNSVSITLNYRTTCGMIPKTCMRSTEHVAERRV